MYNMIILFFLIASISLSAQEIQEKPFISHAVMMKDEIDSLAHDLNDSIKNNTSIQKLWKKYLIKIRSDAKKNRKRVVNFDKHSKFYITLKKTTFIKEFGGFEHTPICIILPVQKKNVLIGQQICTTPSFKRLYPVSKLTLELLKELENLTHKINEEEATLSELNTKHKTLVDLLAKIATIIAEHNDDDGSSDSYNDKPYDEDRLNELMNLYKRQIKELNRTIKDTEEGIVTLRKREKSLRIAYNCILEQMKYYRIPPPKIAKDEKAAPGSPLTKLRELKKMLDEGLINQDNYDATKKKILDSM